MQKLMVIDGNSILNRAFYGLPLLNAPDGTPTNAVLGFFNIMLKLAEEESPTGICVCFDLSAPTFRHRLYTDYKAGRHPTPPELKAQFPLLKELLGLMRIPCLSCEGYEADDLLGTVSQTVTANGGTCVLVTGDRDSMQLIGGGTVLKYCTTQSGHPITKTYDEFKFLLDYGVTPAQYPDVKALMGDSSDNIPGIKGIGEKTAFALISEFGSLDECYEKLEGAKLTPAVRKKLETGREDAYKSKSLVVIRRDAPLDRDPLKIETVSPDAAGMYLRCKALGLENLLKRLKLSAPPEKPPEAVSRSPRTVTEVSDCGFLESLQGDIGFAADFEAASFAVASGAKLWFFAPGPFDPESFSAALHTLFSADVRLSVMDAKALYRYCLAENLPLPRVAFDASLAMSMCETEGKNDDEKAAKLLDTAPAAVCDAVRRADAADKLRELLLPQLAARDSLALYRDTELPLALVLARMEHTGFLVDRDAILNFGAELDRETAELETQIYGLAGETFNINSPARLGEILFEKLGLPHGKKTQRGWSTNADVLNKISDNEIVGKILRYRTYTKLKSTYIDGLLKEIDADGRIRTRFSQLGAATGRLSSLEPNLQNIPVRSEPGSRMRSFFKAGAGCVLVDADYSQIELRILASEAGDRAMTDAFAQGVDIHRMTAAAAFRIPPEQVTPAQRSFAKAVNFGIVYGISDFSLSEDLKISRKEARDMMDRYLETYSGIRDYMKQIVADAKKQGYVSTHFGRRRTLPGINAPNFNVRSAAERVALNAPIQGTAADIIKKAMVAVDRRIAAEGLTGRLILQVHDELIVECPLEETSKMKQILSEEMSGVANFAVKLTVEAGAGETWALAKQ